MACKLILRSLLAPAQPRQLNKNVFCSLYFHNISNPITCFGFNTKTVVKGCGFHFLRPGNPNCSHKNGSTNSASGIYFEQGPPHEAVLKAISDAPEKQVRVGQAKNAVINTDASSNQWLELDQLVNSYPLVRGFTAIGSGGDDFVQTMVNAVESVIQQPIPKSHVRTRISSKGKYVSVKIGPLEVASSDHVQAIYNTMRSDDRVKFFF